jgi:hypothetical protein
MCRRSMPFRLLSISRKQSARTCASADKLGNGAGNGFGLLQQQKVSRTRQVDNPDALAELLAQRVAIARRSRFIIEPLDHEKRSCSSTPPLFERHTPAGREVGEMYRRPAFDLRKYFRIRRRRQPTRPQHGDAIAAVHLDFRSVAKTHAEWRCGSDETASRKQSHAAHQRGPVDRQTASDPIAKGMPDEVRRTAIHSFKDPSDIGGQIVHSYAVERAAALSSTAHVDRDGLQPSGSEHARQVLKITGAAAGIREQHNRSAGPVKGAFERRAADFDVSMLLQSHSPANRLTIGGPKRPVAGRITVLSARYQI